LGAFSPGASIHTFLGVGLLTEIILTAILLAAVMACIEQGNNMNIPKFYLPFMLCLTVAALGMAHSIVTGTMLNPARDLAPRLAALTLGWNSEDIFENINYEGNRQQWWLVGMFGPIIGAVLGVLFYSFCVGAQLPREEEVSRLPEGPTTTDDWRNTVFIPRTVPQTMDNSPMPNHAGYPQNNGGGSAPVKVMQAHNGQAGGQYNQAYNGENNPRQRQQNQNYY
jgi:hypothetical protein